MYKESIVILILLGVLFANCLADEEEYYSYNKYRDYEDYLRNLAAEMHTKN